MLVVARPLPWWQGEQPNLSGSCVLSNSGSGWLVKARAYSSGRFAPFGLIDAAVSFSGSRIPMWQDSQRSTMFASATLILTILGSQSLVFFLRPSIWVGVRDTR